MLIFFQELEEIHIDLANTLNGAMETHALTLLTKVTDTLKLLGLMLSLDLLSVKSTSHNFWLNVYRDVINPTSLTGVLCLYHQLGVHMI